MLDAGKDKRGRSKGEVLLIRLVRILLFLPIIRIKGGI